MAVLIVSSHTTVAQDTLSRWSLGGLGAVNYSYRALQSTAELEQMKEFYDSLETGILAYQLGGAVEYRINNKIHLISALCYNKTGYNIDTLSEASIANMKFRYGFLRLPVRVSYQLREGKVNRPYFSLGVAGNYCIQEKATYTQFGRATIVELERKKSAGKFFPDLNFALGVVKTITPETTFRIAFEA
ncbi:MAG: outer membrane beta-barrel protein, partial [Flavobacteriales bacterium]